MKTQEQHFKCRNFLWFKALWNKYKCQRHLKRNGRDELYYETFRKVYTETEYESTLTIIMIKCIVGIYTYQFRMCRCVIIQHVQSMMSVLEFLDIC